MDDRQHAKEALVERLAKRLSSDFWNLCVEVHGIPYPHTLEQKEQALILVMKPSIK